MESNRTLTEQLDDLDEAERGDAYAALRDALILTEAPDINTTLNLLADLDREYPHSPYNATIVDFAQQLIHADDYGASRERLTGLCLELSLCPLHRVDYAICFDDENDECSAIRLIHPHHDT